jgi:molecular chaperone DnaJ
MPVDLDAAYRVLGVAPGAPWGEVRAAHRRLAKELHPDVTGGDHRRMSEVNLAFAALLAARPHVDAAPEPEPDVTAEPVPAGASGAGTADDPVTFAVDVLPVEAFEALLIVTSFLGDPWVIDEPYELTALLDPPLACRCHLTLVPEAGGTIVTVEVVPTSRRSRPPTPYQVAEALITELSALS